MSERELHWTQNPKRRAEFHWWLAQVNKAHAVNLTYEGVKRHALAVEHLAEFTGTYAQAQRAVLEWVWRIKTEAGWPRQRALKIVP